MSIDSCCIMLNNYNVFVNKILGQIGVLKRTDKFHGELPLILKWAIGDGEGKGVQTVIFIPSSARMISPENSWRHSARMS